MSKLRQLLVTGCAGGLAIYCGYKLGNDHKRVAAASWTTNYVPDNRWDTNWDHRDPTSLVRPINNDVDQTKYKETLKKLKPSAVRNIILIRHGQYETSGITDQARILTPLGRRQAQATGKRLLELNFPYTRLVRSTMTRANETAKIIETELVNRKTDINNNILLNMSIEDCPLLEEGAPCPPEPPIGHWKPEKSQFFQDGPRIEAAFRKYFHRAEPAQKHDSYEILVCHANVIRYFICRALQFPAEAWLRLSLNHASVTWITIQPSGRVIIRCVGDSGHISANEISAN